MQHFSHLRNKVIWEIWKVKTIYTDHAEKWGKLLACHESFPAQRVAQQA